MSPSICHSSPAITPGLSVMWATSERLKLRKKKEKKKKKKTTTTTKTKKHKKQMQSDTIFKL